MKILLSLLLISTIYAKIIDQIEIVVNDIPITTYDIEKMTQKTHNKNEAINILINNALIKSALKEENIYVDDFDVEQRLSIIAKQNDMNLKDFKNMLSQKNQLNKLRQKIKREIQIERLLNAYNQAINNNDLIDYYNNHKKEFEVAAVINATVYISNNKNVLLEVQKNPFIYAPNLKVENQILQYNQTSPQLMLFLSKIPLHSFSNIIPTQDKHSLALFYIVDKKGKTILPFKMVAPLIYEKLASKNEQKNMQDLIAKLKAKANIEFLK